MSETTAPTAAPAPKKTNKSVIIIAILSVVIMVQFIKMYLDHKDKQAAETTIASTEQELASTLQQLNAIKVELDQKITEIQKLGGDVSELQKAKAEIESELKRSRRANGQVIKELKDRVEGYEQLLKLKDEELDKLKSVNKELLSENTTLKTQKNQLGDSINRLAQTKDELATKVTIASQLKAENVSIKAVNDKGKERESPFKNRQLDKLKVEFNLAENNVAPIEGKKIMIRIIDQNNQVLFDVSRGSGTFIYNGKEEFYTASQEILFDNTKQKLTYLYEKGSEYASGSYTLEIYCEDYKIGSGKFDVK
ncbi:MAG TPA: chromosome segregation protein SMC [Cyclobacteriaceae bacterium]|nr:chromosome segregation protein SMC [Cyclobacteriaceae bacterium]HMV09637.1 chromosome segregation protein SMC [Cyclobacteriaceae bacterium]HMV89544.1 chromosome segregation protein SMC [Cyclobacteriaceae bacterium]HMX01031.1 chromosome segregation protein SMC [Cyclobacteriaceae bacterium]HMX52015.1 chromosome segregation protein SMC [Cyclobacteriaceae bacterium]